MVTIDKEVIEEDRDGVTETLMQAIGTDWCELDETMKTRKAKAVQGRLQAILNHEKATTTEVEANESGRRPLRGSRARNCK